MSDADDQSISPRKSAKAASQEHGAGVTKLPAEKGSMYARVYFDAQETELCIAQSGAGAAYQWS
jgi:hypothetical protein